MVLLGLIIVSLCVGYRYEQIDGWMVLGVGFIIVGVIESLLNYLNGDKQND